MIKDMYEAMDDPSKQSIELVQQLLDSEILMAGLGVNCERYPVPTDFPIITDMERSVYLLTSQEMWDEPPETRQDQFFGEIQYGGINPDARYDGEEVRRRRKYVRVVDNETIYSYLDAKFSEVIKRHNIIDYQLSLNSEFEDRNKDVITNVVVNVYVEATQFLIIKIIESGFYDGLDTWPLAHHFYKCLQTGGIPTGYVGALPEDGGDPQKCVQLLHFGPQKKT